MNIIPEHFQRFFAEHASKLKPGTPVLVACSGGPDSVGLVRALKALQQEGPFRFHVGHVNHKLRGRASDGDEAFVRALAREVGWPCHVAVRSMAKLKRGNLEETARIERYGALVKMAETFHCRAILTAHTMDDQAETILMNLLRGTGPDGLGGIHPSRVLKGSRIQLWRPLLDVSKADVLLFLEKGRFKFRSDHSNTDVRYLRNWLRHTLLPLIEARAPGFNHRLSHFSLLQRDEQEFWDAQLKTVESNVLRVKGSRALLDLKGLLRYSPALQRRLLRRVVGPSLMTFDGVEELRRWMMAKPTSGRFWQLRKGWVVERLSKSKGSPSPAIFQLRHTDLKNTKKERL